MTVTTTWTLRVAASCSRMWNVIRGTSYTKRAWKIIFVCVRSGKVASKKHGLCKVSETGVGHTWGVVG